MSTLLQQLTARNLQHYGASKPSFESAEHEDHDELVEEQEDDIDLDDGFEGGLTLQDLEEMGEDLDKKSDLHESFESLLVGTIEAYGVHGMNERGAELYRLSVESLFKQYGMDDFDKVVVPSFEDSATREEHTEKAAEKGTGVLKRIWDSLVAAYDAFTTAVGDFFRRIFTGAQTIEKAVGKLKEKAKSMGAKGDKVNVGTAGRYLVNRSGSPLTGAAQVHELMTDMQKFSTYWIDAWEGITDAEAVKKLSHEASAQAMFQQIIAGSYVLKRITDVGSFQMNPLPNHLLVVEAESTAENAVFKAKKTTFEFSGKGLAEQAALDKAGVEGALTAVEKACAAYRKMDTEVQKRLKATKAFISQVKTIETRFSLLVKVAEGNGRRDLDPLRNLVKSAKSMINASKLLQFGWSQVLTQFLQYLRANLKHVAASIKAAGKGEAAAEPAASEKKDDHTDSNEEKK